MNIDILLRGLAELDISADSGQIGQIEAYYNELTLWNTKLGLVSAEGDQLLIRHILDSLSGLKTILRLPSARIADIGSGGGLPGIPLSIFLPESEMSLVERSARKTGFLMNAVALTGLNGRVNVLQKNLEELTGSFDIVVFRAFRRLEDFLIPLKAVLAENGTIIAYKGKLEKIEEEAGTLEQYSLDSEIIEVTVPFLDESRHLMLIRRS